VIASGRLEYHVSVSRPGKPPTATDVEEVRRAFFPRTDAEIDIHGGHLNKRVVHLWEVLKRSKNVPSS